MKSPTFTDSCSVNCSYLAGASCIWCQKRVISCKILRKKVQVKWRWWWPLLTLTLRLCSAALQQPLHSQWDTVPCGFGPWRWAGLGRQTGTVAETAQTRRRDQQSTHGLLPKSLEDPSKVPRPVNRWICVALLHHKRSMHIWVNAQISWDSLQLPMARKRLALETSFKDRWLFIA